MLRASLAHLHRVRKIEVNHQCRVMPGRERVSMVSEADIEIRYSMPNSANAATSAFTELWLRDMTSAFSLMSGSLPGTQEAVKVTGVTRTGLLEGG